MEKSHGEDHDGDATSDGGKIVAGESFLHMLLEDCISYIISLTSPRDACVVASVSKIFKSAAQSDIVWERFLPPDYPSLFPEPLVYPSKKELYLALSDHPVLIDQGKKRFWLDKPSGRKCYMISAMDLTIIWGDTPAYWQWISVPESRFERVAELLNVCWFEVRGKISTRMLSPGTHYVAYIVFKRRERFFGFSMAPMEAGVGVGVVGSEASHRSIWFDADGGRELRERRRFGMFRGFRRFQQTFRSNAPQEEEETSDILVEPKERGDGWVEVELGEFLNIGCENGSEEIEITVMETKSGRWKSGLILEGIEIRPKRDCN